MFSFKGLKRASLARSLTRSAAGSASDAQIAVANSLLGQSDARADLMRSARSAAIMGATRWGYAGRFLGVDVVVLSSSNA